MKEALLVVIIYFAFWFVIFPFLCGIFEAVGRFLTPGDTIKDSCLGMIMEVLVEKWKSRKEDN